MKQQFIKCSNCNSVQLSYLIHSHQMIRCESCEKEANIALWKRLKALSIKQPWSWLIVNGYKDIENRNTLKNFRGTFLIHAGAKPYNLNLWDPDIAESHAIKHMIEKDMNIGWENHNKFNYGGIIGYAEIYDCVQESDSPWFVGKNGLMIRNPKPLPFTPCKGKLSFFYPEID